MHAIFTESLKRNRRSPGGQRNSFANPGGKMSGIRRVQGSLLVGLFLLAIPSFGWDQHKNAPPAQHAAPAPHPAPQQHAQPQQHQQQPPRQQQGNSNRGPGGGTGHPNNGPNNQNAGHGPNGGGNNANGGPNNNARGPAGGGNNAHAGNNANGPNNNARGGGVGGGNTRNGATNNNNARGGANGNNNNNAGGGTNGNNNARGGAAGNNARGGNNAGPNAHNANNRGPNGNRRGPATTTREIHTRNGGAAKASYRGGHVRSVETRRGDRNIRIEHGARGQRRVVSEHNGRRVVSYGRRGGYSERAYYNHGGRAYYQRTYYYGGRRYAYAYRSYYYGGVRYYGYAPAYYYQPVYYGWAYNPWPAPVYYNWGYYNAPWYGYYGYYYQPYPSYPTAAWWITDFMVAASLQAAYEAAQNGENHPPTFGPDPALSAELSSSDDLVAGNFGFTYGSFYGTAPAKTSAPASAAKLSPELKQALADEVKQSIADEKDAAGGKDQASGGNDLPPGLNPKFKYFMVANNLSVTDDDGNDCDLNAGDVIERTGEQIDEDHNVAVTVRASQKDDCAVGASVAVDANDLQEMHNNFRQQMDAGLKELADKSGKDGLPKAPDTSTKSGEVPAPTPDQNVDSELQQNQKDADDTDADVPQQDTGGQQ